jgi:hypothetical protein
VNNQGTFRPMSGQNVYLSMIREPCPYVELSQPLNSLLISTVQCRIAGLECQSLFYLFAKAITLSNYSEEDIYFN